MKDYTGRYDKLGWIVMPIKSNDKRPIIKNWTNITSNEETLDKFKEDSNIGIIMGKVSGVICLDIDIKKTNGVETLKQLEEQYGNLPATVTSETPSGGIHYYFNYVEGIRNRKVIGKGIDVQADGTQTLETPSQIDGVKYEWIYSPFESEVANLPPAWIDLLCEKVEDDTIGLIPKPFEPPEEIEEGSRNNTITRFVASMLGKGLKKDTILRKVVTYNKEVCVPPLDEDELLSIVDSIIKTDINNKSKKVKEGINCSLPKSVEAEASEEVPPWIKFDETGSVFIDEKKFAEWYVERNQIHCVNTRFFSRYGLIDDAWFESNIHNIIGTVIKVRLASKVSDLLRSIKHEAYKEIGTPDPYKVQFDNCAFNLRNGSLVLCDDFFTLHQIPHNYDKDAECPIWKKYLKELFYEEDIPVVQEYLGYCLLPNTLAQTSLFVVGDGGEGKSRISIMMEHIIGANSVVVGDFKGLQEKFSMTSLDNQMLFIEDDLSSDALDDTSNFKKIVTAETMMEVEPKGKMKYKTKLYAKILCCGNCSVSSKFDRSDGFYRRLLVSKVKPLDRSRAPDRELVDKMKLEVSGIINWLLEGAVRVVQGGFIIKGSERMIAQVQEIKDNQDTITLFINDEQYVNCSLDKDKRVSMRQLYNAYETWCNDNGFLFLHKNTFAKLSRLSHKQALILKYHDTDEVREIVGTERVYVNGKQVRGFAGIEVFTKSFTIER